MGRGRFQFWLSLRTLKVDFHCKLQDSRVARRGHLVVQRGYEVGRRAANRIGMVEGVESFEAQLAGNALGELHVLEEGKVRAPEARGADGTGALGGLRGLCRGRRRESCSFKPTCEGMWSAGVGVANLIWTATQGRCTEQA